MFRNDFFKDCCSPALVAQLLSAGVDCVGIVFLLSYLCHVTHVDDDDCCKRCPPGWTQFDDHCYTFHFNGKDWTDAEVQYQL